MHSARTGRMEAIVIFLPGGVGLSHPLLFTIFLLCSTGIFADGIAVNAGGNLLVSSAEGWSPKAQAGACLDLGVSYLFSDLVGPAVSFSFRNQWPSDAANGFVYRGYMEFGLSLLALAQWKLISAPDLGDIRWGVGGGFGASMGLYQYTTLAFFIPSIEMSAFASWSPAGMPSMDLTVSLPLSLVLRRDLGWSFSVGLSVGVGYIPWRSGAVAQ
jgi:hypothetical protein